MSREILEFCFNNSLTIFSGITIFTLFIRWTAWASSRKDYFFFQSISKNIDSELGKTDGIFTIDTLDKSLVTIFRNISSLLPKRFFHRQKTPLTRPYMQTDFIDHDEFVAEHSFYHGLIKEIDSFKSAYPHSWPDMSKKMLREDRYWTNAYGILPISSITKLTNFLPQGLIFLGIISSFIGMTLTMPAIAEASLSGQQWNIFFNEFMGQLSFSLYPIIYALIFSFIIAGINNLFQVSVYRKDTINVIANTLENIWLKVNRDQTMEGKFQKYFPTIIEQLKQIKQGAKGLHRVS